MKSLLLLSTLFLMLIPISGQNSEIRLEALNDGLMTLTIQNAIDSCAASGGGRVLFSEGTYLTGGLQLRDHVHLHLEKGSRLIKS